MHVDKVEEEEEVKEEEEEEEEEEELCCGDAVAVATGGCDDCDDCVFNKSHKLCQYIHALSTTYTKEESQRQSK